MDNPLKIYLQDSAFAHCIFSNNPMPPKQYTDKVEWVRDGSFTNQDIVVWTDIDKHGIIFQIYIDSYLNTTINLKLFGHMIRNYYKKFLTQ